MYRYVFSKPMDAADETNRCAAGLAPLAAEVRADGAVVAGVAELRGRHAHIRKVARGRRGAGWLHAQL